MKPGEIIVKEGNIEINPGKEVITIKVENAGDRPVQVGSHYHFFEVNPALNFDREKTKGFRLNIVSGTAIRFEPGDQREVNLVPYSGLRRVFGFNGKVNSSLD